jgi:hypothetical protein
MGRFARLPVLTVRFYHDITKRRAVQAFLENPGQFPVRKSRPYTNSMGGFQNKRVNR